MNVSAAIDRLRHFSPFDRIAMDSPLPGVVRRAPVGTFTLHDELNRAVLAGAGLGQPIIELECNIWLCLGGAAHRFELHPNSGYISHSQ